MKLHLLENREAIGWTTFGGYWPEGMVRSSSFSLHNADGTSIPVQSEIAARWEDGSVKWSRHTASADALGKEGELQPVEKSDLQGSLNITETEAWFHVVGEKFEITVYKTGSLLAGNYRKEGQEAFHGVYPVLSVAHAEKTLTGDRCETIHCGARIIRTELETSGPLIIVFRFDGVHLENGKEKMPFRIRMSIYADGTIHFDDTFFFRGNAEKDRLAGWGLRFETSLTGKSYQRMIRFMTDGALYRDHVTQLFHWRKRLGTVYLEKQNRDELVKSAEALDEAAADLPAWDHFILVQDSAWHYSIRKKAWEEGCWLEGVQGKRAPGTMTVSDSKRSLSFHIRDFWEKHPAGLETKGLAADQTVCTAWFYAPAVEPFDFRHYDKRSYPSGNYEGFDYSRPDPNGIAVTCSLEVIADMGICSEEDMRRQNFSVRKPPVYAAEPEYYHTHRAFGRWSLPVKDTETGRWVEKQIEAACDFYLEEREARSWYGLFNYGDFMHTYEASRHMWRWDVGGYAWDNTELVPTYWLWLQYMRTGSEKVYSLAEALSRHAADVDMYHFGYMKGLGSRHNVRHWGCPCKEPRVSMAGHHRPLYYLAGNRRIGDCMEDALSSGESLHAMPWYTLADGSLRVRSGPDWAAMVSDWMTAYERTLDPKWKQMILTGIEDLKRAPLGLTSGPQFGFEPESGHLIYKGEATSPESMHLQACMGGTEIWLEVAEMIHNTDLEEMTAVNGRYFYLSEKERMAASGGLLKGRTFQSPIYSAEMQAWAAHYMKDQEMAKVIWRNLLGLLYAPEVPDGYLSPETYAVREDGTALKELPWITTNFTAQWCLKVIVAMDLIPDAGLDTLDELANALKSHPSEYRLYGA